MSRTIYAIAIAILLSACSGSGSEYLGHWENTKNAKDAFSVVRNGDGFLIVRTKRNMWNGNEEGEEKIPAVLKDGLLHVQGGMGGPALGYIEASDTLTAQGFMGSVEFKRKD